MLPSRSLCGSIFSPLFCSRFPYLFDYAIIFVGFVLSGPLCPCIWRPPWDSTDHESIPCRLDTALLDRPPWDGCSARTCWGIALTSSPFSIVPCGFQRIHLSTAYPMADIQYIFSLSCLVGWANRRMGLGFGVSWVCVAVDEIITCTLVQWGAVQQL